MRPGCQEACRQAGSDRQLHKPDTLAANIQSPMKLIFILLFSACYYSLFGQAVSLQEYFPLKNGVGRLFYVSHISGTDTLQTDNDSSICKSLLIKGKEIFYFDDNLFSDDNTIIGSNSFCDGVFYYENGNFIFSPLFWKYELKEANLDYFETLFPAKISFDTIYKYQDGEEKRKYTFIGFEDVYIKDKLYKDCLKLIITQDWKTAQYIDTVWFFKGLGVVKWLRGTGRLEEIKL